MNMKLILKMLSVLWLTDRVPSQLHLVSSCSCKWHGSYQYWHFCQIFFFNEVIIKLFLYLRSTITSVSLVKLATKVMACVSFMHRSRLACAITSSSEGRADIAIYPIPTWIQDSASEFFLLQHFRHPLQVSLSYPLKMIPICPLCLKEYVVGSEYQPSSHCVCVGVWGVPNLQTASTSLFTISTSLLIKF